MLVSLLVFACLLPTSTAIRCYYVPNAYLATPTDQGNTTATCDGDFCTVLSSFSGFISGCFYGSDETLRNRCFNGAAAGGVFKCFCDSAFCNVPTFAIINTVSAPALYSCNTTTATGNMTSIANSCTYCYSTNGQGQCRAADGAMFQDYFVTGNAPVWPGSCVSYIDPLTNMGSSVCKCTANNCLTNSSSASLLNLPFVQCYVNMQQGTSMGAGNTTCTAHYCTSANYTTVGNGTGYLRSCFNVSTLPGPNTANPAKVGLYQLGTYFMQVCNTNYCNGAIPTFPVINPPGSSTSTFSPASSTITSSTWSTSLMTTGSTAVSSSSSATTTTTNSPVQSTTKPSSDISYLAFTFLQVLFTVLVTKV